MKRRHLLAAGLGALAAPAVARADTKFPDRTIRLVVPFPAGGATDVIGRTLYGRFMALSLVSVCALIVAAGLVHVRWRGLA